MSPRRSNFDEDECARAIRLLHPGPGNVTEVRILKAEGGATVSGYFDWEHLPEMARAAAEWSGHAPGVHFTLNPVNPTVAARAFNPGSTHENRQAMCNAARQPGHLPEEDSATYGSPRSPTVETSRRA